MNDPLRPMNLGAILDRSFHIYRSRFLVFVGLAVPPVIAMDLIYSADEFWLHARSRFHPATPTAAYLWAFVIGTAFYQMSRIFGILTQPAFVQATSGVVLGNACSLRDSIWFALARWKSSFWIAILKLAADSIIPGTLAAAIGAIMVANSANLARSGSQFLAPLINLMAMVVGFILFLWIGACLSFSIPAMALENLTGLNSLRRSLALSKGSRGRIVFTLLSTFVAVWVLSYGLEFLLGHLMSFVGSVLNIAKTMRALYSPAVSLLVTAIYIVIGPFLPIAITLFYYDQRIRREGYDVERMMVAAGLNPNAAETPAALPTHGLDLPAEAQPIPAEGNQQA
jgi:hypothetical protein